MPAGDIHIWDRESGTLLHHIRAQAVGGDLTCIAWNHAWDTFMFATGSHDGGVRVWTSPSNIPYFGTPGLGSEDFLSVVSQSRAPTNAANTPRSLTPLPYDADGRPESPVPPQTESPVTVQFLSASQDSHVSGNGNGAVAGPSETTRLKDSIDTARRSPSPGRPPAVVVSR